jgi:hypothetical protein
MIKAMIRMTISIIKSTAIMDSMVMTMMNNIEEATASSISITTTVVVLPA